jgi:hypothetical protein
MNADDKQEPGQEPPETGIELPEDPGYAGAEDEVEAHAEQEIGEDTPWCIGCAD